MTRSRIRGLGLLLLFGLGFLMMVPMLWVTSTQTALVDYGYKVTELKAEEERLLEEQAYLRAELARLKTPERVFQSMRELGLRPNWNQVVVSWTDEPLTLQAKREEERP